MFPKRYFTPEFFAERYFPPSDGGSSGTVYYAEVTFESLGQFDADAKRIQGRRSPRLTFFKQFASLDMRAVGIAKAAAHVGKHSQVSFESDAGFYAIPRQNNFVRWSSVAKSSGSIRDNKVSFTRLGVSGKSRFDTQPDKTSYLQFGVMTRGIAKASPRVGQYAVMGVRSGVKFSSTPETLEQLVFFTRESAMVKHETSLYQQR